MPCHTINGTFLLLLLSAMSVEAAGPVRIDLSLNSGRRDAETFAWLEWEIGKETSPSKAMDVLTVTLDSPAPIEGFLHKPALATGATLAADGISAAGPIEITIAGLPPGRHSLATYHNLPKGEKVARVEVEVGGNQCIVEPSLATHHDDNMATCYVEFEVEQGQPAIANLTAQGAGSVVLNAIEIDAGDPRRQAQRPSPADFDEHVDGQEGRIALAWTPADSAAKHLVYLASDRDWNVAMSEARNARGESPLLVGVTDGKSLEVEVDPHDSLQHYCWRVDSVDDKGQVTRGDVWSFRVRHLAFPSAEGYGRFAIGGRGGKVLKVTNLNDSGPGSLRAAVEARGPRTIVFDVGGRIDLKSQLTLRDNYVTLAGQTAPGKGICISNYSFGMLGAHDNIIRYLRVRPGNTSGETLDGMGMASCDHAIVDHCSISWTQDEAFSSRGAKNITLQRTLISEALNIAGHRKYKDGSQHGFAASIGGDIGSFHHNLLAHCAGRNWSLAGGIDQANVHAGQLDIRNNVVYNWAYRTTDGGARQVQFVNNYYKPGPATTLKTYLNPQFENPAFGPQQYYVEGNMMEGVVGPEGPVGPFKGMKVRGHQKAPVTVSQPFFEHYVETQSAEEAYSNVLNDVGCNLPMLDEHDQRVLRETRDGTTTFVGSRSGLPGLPDAQQDVGGWEEYPEAHRPSDWDADDDGMPNDWEVARGLDPENADDGSQDANGDGYTNLEEYLNNL